ncbi:unnamed protein product [Parnassius apollo]|uniref:(apollo) hypothetical protein n=1 Tax=Parnassius apollo TaxID=110799 RepID=A0A8S3WTV5_PARAO|nr:unnamed protein product [Parnassius apollo]
MESKAGPSGSKSTSSSRKKRRHSDEYESDYSNEDVYYQRADEDSSSSKVSSSCGSDDSIFDTRLKQKTTSRVPPAQPSRSPASKTASLVPPPQPSSSSASKRGLCESDGRPIIQCKRLRPTFRDGPTRNNSAQSWKLPDPNSSSASKPAPRQLEFDGDGSFEFNYEIDCRPTSPNIVQDYGDFSPDIPDSCLLNPTCSTPSVSLLRSDAITPNLSTERNDASPSILAIRRSVNSTPELLDNYYLSPNNSPSGQGATTTWSSDPSSMKNIEFTKDQELLVPPPTDPYEAFRLLIDDELLDLIVRETNANAIRVGNAQNVKQNSRIKSWKDLTKEELLTFLGLLLNTETIRLNRLSDYWNDTICLIFHASDNSWHEIVFY